MLPPHPHKTITDAETTTAALVSLDKKELKSRKASSTASLKSVCEKAEKESQCKEEISK
jgi:hypothetical protein